MTTQSEMLAPPDQRTADLRRCHAQANHVAAQADYSPYEAAWVVSRCMQEAGWSDYPNPTTPDGWEP